MADDQLLNRYGRDFARGTVLFREGDPGSEMFVLQRGRVDISKKVGDAETILSTLGPGEFFGEMAILSHRPRSATATVVEDSRILVFDTQTFETMISSNTEIALRMIRKLADRLQAADDQISNLLLRDVSSRIVHYLSSAVERTGRGKKAGPTRLPLKLEQLPALVGVDRAEVEEVLDKLVRTHLVSLEAEALVVHDSGKLRHFLNFLVLRSQFEDNL
jgi:CRP-like cAMP-binding protein